MEKDYIKKLAMDQKYISGIYNYCDAWCERCPFTSRCLNFTITEEHFSDLEDRDVMNEAFWDKLSEMLQIAFSMVSEMAKREGVDLDSADVESPFKDETPFESDEIVHMTSHLADAYADQVDEWFADNEYLIHERENELNAATKIKLVRPGAPTEAVSLVDVIEVIQWYQIQIPVKIRRALDSHREELADPSEDFPSDADGSAKVALIGIDRSLSAWGEMLNHFPALKDAIMKMIVRLNRLQKMIEREFPNARAFVRPGFDEIHCNE
ncbi:MAG: hypothetical protein GY859_21510 [Desulfobacterales bacterium]|nr:hypothetical protein [Desulfobacterales bacterium]